MVRGIGMGDENYKRVDTTEEKKLAEGGGEGTVGLEEFVYDGVVRAVRLGKKKVDQAPNGAVATGR